MKWSSIIQYCYFFTYQILFIILKAERFLWIRPLVGSLYIGPRRQSLSDVDSRTLNTSAFTTTEGSSYWIYDSRCRCFIGPKIIFPKNGHKSNGISNLSMYRAKRKWIKEQKKNKNEIIESDTNERWKERKGEERKLVTNVTFPTQKQKEKKKKNWHDSSYESWILWS